jgi:hypothetical protein
MNTEVETEIARNVTHTTGVDIDIGADAVDHKYVPLRFPLIFFFLRSLFIVL